MSIIGDSPQWRDPLIDVYQLIRDAIVRVWPDCQNRIRKDGTDVPVAKTKRGNPKARLEDPITQDLIIRIRRDSRIRTSFINIESQLQILPTEPDDGSDAIGYLDIAIQFYLQEDYVCMAIECKRLHVVRPTGRRDILADRYINNGMMRFVSGQYSPQLSVGGMIGYVLDGDLNGAHMALIAQIKKSSAMLLCDPSSVTVLSHPDYFTTKHERRDFPIELRHMLLYAN